MDSLGPQYVRPDLHAAGKQSSPTKKSRVHLPSFSSSSTVVGPALSGAVCSSHGYISRRSGRTQARLKGRVQKLLDEVFLSRQRPLLSLEDSACRVPRKEGIAHDPGFQLQVSSPALRLLSSVAFQPFSFIPSAELDLRLWGNVLTDAALLYVAGLNAGACRVLDITGCFLLTDDGLKQALLKCSGVQVLNLAGCSGITDEGVQNALRICGESLVSLNLAGEIHAGHQLLISDRSLSAIADYCPVLCKLVLSDQPGITDTGMLRVCASCAHIAAVDVRRCQRLTEKGLEAMAKRWANGLASLKISGLDEVDAMPFAEFVAHAPYAVEIEAEGLRISDEDVRAFVETKTLWGYRAHPPLARLLCLDLSSCPNLTDLALAWISTGCPSLRKLNVRACTGIGDVGLKSTGAMRRLESLDISHCSLISDTGISYLTSCRSLTDLDMSWLSKVSEKGLEQVFLGAGQRLSSLKLEHTCGVSNAVVRLLLKQAGNRLYLLNLAHNKLLSVEGIGALTKRCMAVVEVNLSFCSAVDDGCLAALAHLKHCKALDLSHCLKLTSLGMNHLPNWRLEKLLLCANVLLDDQAVRIICKTCHRLQHLSLAFCPKISAHAIEHLLTPACPSLSYLDLSGCPLISLHVLTQFAQHPSRTTLFLQAFHAPTAVLHPTTNNNDVNQVPTSSSTQFSGCKPHPFSHHMRHQHKAAILESTHQLSAIRLQSAFRGRQARAFASQRLNAALLIQRILRGAASRLRSDRYKQRRLWLACQLQKLWRKLWMRREMQRAAQWHRCRMLRRHLLEWRRCAQAMHEQRLVVGLEERLRAADERFCRRMLLARLYIWREMCAVWKHERLLWQRAVRSWTVRMWTKAYAAWAAEARREVRRRKRLVSVFLNCTSLTSRNALAIKNRVNLALRFHDRRVKRRIIDAWHTCVRAARRRFAAAEAFHWEVLKRTKGRAALRGWRIYLGRRRAHKEAKKRAARWFEEKQAHRCLRQLRRHYAVAVQKVALRSRADDFRRHRLLYVQFNSWVELVQLRKAERQKQSRAAAYMVHSIVTKMFYNWRRAARRLKYQRNAVKWLIAQKNAQAQAEAMYAWRLRARELRGFRVKVRAAEGRRRCAEALARMKAFAAASVTERRQQFQRWERLSLAAIEVQRRWRGLLGRERFEHLRLTWQLQAVTIQKYTRRWLSKRVAHHLERKHRLREYLRAEAECDAMQAEEEMGMDLVRQYRAARLVQNRYRSRASRAIALISKRKLQAEREQQRRANVAAQMELHLERQAQREEQALRTHDAATNIQRVYRALQARQRYHEAWTECYLSKRATCIQSAYRTRMALRYVSGLKRHDVFKQKTLQQQQRSAAILRMLMLRNKWAQGVLGRRLAMLGAHPDSYTLERSKMRREVLEDAKEWMAWAAAYARAVRKGKRGRAMKAFYVERQAHESVGKGDAVQIVERGHPYRGLTGYVLNVYNASNVPGREQATVKLDHNQEIIFIALKTAETKTQASSNSMIKVHEARAKAPPYSAESPISPEKIRQNRERLVNHAQEHIGQTRRHIAATKIQGMYRWKRLKRFIKQQYPIQREKDLAAQAKVLRRLRRLRLDNPLMGRLLIRAGLILPRHVPPELQNRPIAPALARYIQRRENKRVLSRQAFFLLATIRYQLYLAGTLSDDRPLRRRTAVVVLLRKIHALLPLQRMVRKAEALLEEAEESSGAPRVAKQCGAKVLFGIAGSKTEETAHTWIGLFHFRQFQRSTHVVNEGWALFHGAWYPQQIPQSSTSTILPAAWVRKAINHFKDLPHGQGEVHFLPRQRHTDALRRAAPKQRRTLKPLWLRRKAAKTAGHRKASPQPKAQERFHPRTFFPSYDSDEDDGAPVPGFTPVAALTKQASSPSIGDADVADDADGEDDDYPARHREYAWMKCHTQHGEVSGEVTLRMRNGSVYTGPYVAEDVHLDQHVHNLGQNEHLGRWESAAGLVYIGSSVSNHFDEEDVSALDICVETAEETYEGSMWRNLRHGYGRLTCDDGTIYLGEWVKGQRDGHGKEWRIGKEEWYAGAWVKGKKTGACRAALGNGRMYIGEMENGRMHGRGKLVTADGDEYEGSFVDEVFEGEGCMRYADGSVYKGGWKGGQRDCSMGQFEDPDGNRYEVPFQAGEMEGCGVLFEKTMNHHPLEKYCVWQQGFLVRVLRMGIHPALTNEFNSRFTHYKDYRSPFAMLIAQRLPSLPPGVDPDNRSVEQHVHGILMRAGPLSCSKVIEESEAQVAKLQVSVKDAYKKLVHARRVLAAKQEEVVVARARAEAHAEVVDEAADDVKSRKQQVLSFWQTDDVRLDYWRAVGALVEANRNDFYAMKQLRYPPPSWLMLWKAIALALGEENPSMRSFKLLVGSSVANAEAGDESAMKRDYDVKLLAEIKHFNVYDHCSTKLLADLSAIVHHKDMNTTNAELKQCSKLSPLLVHYLKAVFHYCKKAATISSEFRNLKIRKEKLKTSRQLLLIKQQTLRELQEEEAKLKTTRDHLYHDHAAAEEALANAQLALDRAGQCAAIAHSDAAQRLLEEQPDHARIKPWLSREEEAIRNACQQALDEVMDLIINVPVEIHDILTTIKEHIVDEDNYALRHGTTVPQPVRDLLSEVVNATVGGVELQVSDALNAICQQIAGPPSAIKQRLNEVVTNIAQTVGREVYEEDRRLKYLHQRVIVWQGKGGHFDDNDVENDQFDDVEHDESVNLGGHGFERFGTCTAVYDKEVVRYEAAHPGPGMIYCDQSTMVFAYEDSCDFTKEVAVGWFISLPSLDGSQLEEREVVALFNAYQLELDHPFPSHCLSGNWTRDWALRDPNKVVHCSMREVCDVAYDDGQVEVACPLRKVKLQAVVKAGRFEERILEDEESSEDSDHVGEGAKGEKDDEEKSNGEREVWEVFYDSEEDAPYWFNPHTQQTTWAAPEGFNAHWRRYRNDESGAYYWHNALTNESTWIDPYTNSSS